MNIPEKMKAAVLFGYNDLRVVEKPVPRPGKDEVLIRVKACAICGNGSKGSSPTAGRTARLWGSTFWGMSTPARSQSWARGYEIQGWRPGGH